MKLKIDGFKQDVSFTQMCYKKCREQKIPLDLIAEAIARPVKTSTVTKFPHQKRYHYNGITVILDGHRIVAVFA